MTTGADWAEANQRYLMARLALVREHLAGAPGDAAEAVERMAAELPAPAALDRLCDAFSLSPFERDVLVLCAGVELDGVQREPPTFSLALAQLPQPHWSAITPAGPLRRWRLVDAGSGDTLTRAPLRIDERVLHFLTGLTYLDPRLEGLLTAAPPANDLPPSHRAVGRRLADLLAAGASAQLMGDDHGEKLDVAAYACALLGVSLWTLRATDLPLPTEREALCRLWEREAVLSRGALLVDVETTIRGASWCRSWKASAAS